MNIRFAPLLLALVLTGCPETALVCGPGEIRDGDRECVPDPRDSGVVQPDGGRDAGPDADADAGTDAGVVCEPACEGTEPYCIELGEGDPSCVQCRDAGDCDDEEMCVGNECVRCVEDSDCPAETPICDGGSCRECVTGSTANDCADRTGTPVCRDDGQCVQCTAQDETACTGLCDLLRNECTTITPRSAGPCDPCVNDAQCPAGQLCVPQEFGTAGAVVSHVCAWAIGAVGAGAPNGACSNVPPYRAAHAVTSLGGGGVAPVTGDVCLLEVSTCEAHRDFQQSCMIGAMISGPVADDSCGAEGHDDGFCARRDAASNLCTVECSALADCPCSGGTCTSRYECASGFCSLSRTCLVASPSTCTP